MTVRETTKPDFEKLEIRKERLDGRIGDPEQRVSRLEGSIEGTMRL